MKAILSYVIVCVVIVASIRTSLSCPPGWLLHANSCYHFSHDTEPWTGAFTMCNIIGGKLVEIDSAEENSYLAAQAMLSGQQYWIGLTDIQEENTWVWANSHKVLQQGVYSNWSPGEPNNSGNDENCAILQSNAIWNDGPCKVTAQYICEVENEGTEVVG